MTAPYRDDHDALRDRLSAAERELEEVRRTLGDVERLKSAERELTQEVEALRSRLKGLRGKRSLPLLEQIGIASPCNADWEAMAGDHKVRVCGVCDKRVYNLSAMTRQDAEQMILEVEGNVCIRMYKRRDGTVLTADCPVGASNKRRRRMVAAGTVAGALTSAGLLAPSGVLSIDEPVVEEVEIPTMGETIRPLPAPPPLEGRGYGMLMGGVDVVPSGLLLHFGPDHDAGAPIAPGRSPPQGKVIISPPQLIEGRAK